MGLLYIDQLYLIIIIKLYVKYKIKYSYCYFFKSVIISNTYLGNKYYFYIM